MALASQALSPNKTLEQLGTLRQSLRDATLGHFRHQLSKKIPTAQVNRILNHPNINLELDTLIRRVTLDPQSNPDSLSFQIAKSLSEVTEPHVRLAVNLSTNQTGEKPEDIIQTVLKNNASVRTAYEPLRDSLRPLPTDRAISRLREQISSPLVEHPNHHPTLEPAVESIVAMGAPDANPAKNQQTADKLHQDLLAQILSKPPSFADNTQIVRQQLQDHGLDPNQIDSNSLRRFTDYYTQYAEIISQDRQIETIQKIAAASHLSPADVTALLQASHQTPEEFIEAVQIPTVAQSLPKDGGGPSTAVTTGEMASPTTPIQVKAAIERADSFNYSNEPNQSGSSPSLRDFINLIKEFQKLTQNSRQNLFSQSQTGLRGFIDNVRSIIFPGSSPEGGPMASPGGSAGGNPFGQTLGNMAKNGFSQAGRAASSAAKSGAKAAAKAALQAAKAALQAIRKISAGFVKSLLLNPYFWAAIVGIIIIVAVIFLISGAGVSPQKIALLQTDSISGVGGNPGGGATFTCQPDDPGCPQSLCLDCAWPVTCGSVTQCPGGEYTHATSNAIDFGMNYCDPENMGVYSQVAGTIIAVVMNYDDGTGEAGSPEGYGNYVEVAFTDSESGRSFLLLYGHLSNQNIVSVGDQVAPGQIIGYADHTGNSTAPHLHYELRATDGTLVPSITTIVPNSGCL